MSDSTAVPRRFRSSVRRPLSFWFAVIGCLLLAVGGCTGSTAPEATPVAESDLVGVWLPVEITGYSAERPDVSLSKVFSWSPVRFDGKGRWEAFDSCNRHRGSIAVGAKGSVSVGPVLQIGVGCYAGTVPNVAVLESASRAELDRNGGLRFLDADARLLGRYTRSAEPFPRGDLIVVQRDGSIRCLDRRQERVQEC